MRDLFYIDTENRFGQILVFENYDSAVEWCKKATTWNEEQIKNKVRKSVSYGTTYTSLYTYKD